MNVLIVKQCGKNEDLYYCTQCDFYLCKICMNSNFLNKKINDINSKNKKEFWYFKSDLIITI